MINKGFDPEIARVDERQDASTIVSQVAGVTVPGDHDAIDGGSYGELRGPRRADWQVDDRDRLTDGNLVANVDSDRADDARGLAPHLHHGASHRRLVRADEEALLAQIKPPEREHHQPRGGEGEYSRGAGNAGYVSPAGGRAGFGRPRFTILG
ncbi:MAG: hypothetical protein HW416_2019 [Chloroflexi bacterium]|nr:hypothetical protein [Chloroflexota bacterium]